jgi:hypothetical protein
MERTHQFPQLRPKKPAANTNGVDAASADLLDQFRCLGIVVITDAFSSKRIAASLPRAPFDVSFRIARWNIASSRSLSEM